jgi:hypothetical protein
MNVAQTTFETNSEPDELWFHVLKVGAIRVFAEITVPEWYGEGA